MIRHTPWQEASSSSPKPFAPPDLGLEFSMRFVLKNLVKPERKRRNERLIEELHELGDGTPQLKSPTCSLNLGFPRRQTNLVPPNVCSTRARVECSGNTRNRRRRALRHWRKRRRGSNQGARRANLTRTKAAQHLGRRGKRFKGMPLPRNSHARGMGIRLQRRQDNRSPDARR